MKREASKNRLALAVVGGLILANLGSAQEKFPVFKAAPLLLVGEWDQAEAVVVGGVENIKQMGVQRSVHLSWPIPEGEYPIYWCEADFRVYATIKGRAPAAEKKFVWGSGVSGCKLPSHGQRQDVGPITQVWFVREEGNYLRPVADYSAQYFYELYASWDKEPSPPPQIRFAELLLTPSANGGFPEPASLACFILGRDECIRRIQALADLGDPDLRRQACSYLDSQFAAECPP
jgi:hypothetical protein